MIGINSDLPWVYVSTFLVLFIMVDPEITLDPSDAPFIDLSLIQNLAKYSTMSTTGLKSIGCHLWYLGEEMASLSLFSDIIPVETKCLIVACLQDILGQQELNSRSIRCVIVQDLYIKTLDFFYLTFFPFPL